MSSRAEAGHVRNQRRVLPVLLLAASVGAGTVACSSVSRPPPGSIAPAPNPSTRPGAELANAVLARPDLAAYHGWIEYLSFQAEHGVSPAEAAAQRDSWSSRILANPALIGELRGVQEWAYLSPADGSGQPFRISIPASYDGTRALPLSVYLHGVGANHLEFPQAAEQLTAWSADAGFIEVAVLGRARGAGYTGLAEADVLHVIDYVAQHFRVDLDRVHLVGASMGGLGVMLLGARHPHRFASAWSVCGSSLEIPVANLLTLPVYATHSDDDLSVPPLMMRGAIEHLPKLGGKAVWDETTGYGHRVWRNLAGNERARRWAFDQVRPSSRAVRHIDFTALDGNAARAWWAEVEEWGPRPEPARFVLRAEGNVLHAELHNVLALRLHLAESPLDPRRPIRIVVRGDGGAPSSAELRIEPGAAAGSVVLALDPETGAARLAPPSSLPSRRLHTPGGADLLYDGEPLLIVYGTRGDAAMQRAQREAAALASHSANSGWFEADATRPHTNGVPLRFNLYGELSVKADVDVSADDVARHHLVLIGTAEENTLVASLADRLPVTFSSERIEFDDGVRVPAAGATLRLVYQNPAAPERRLYWVASNDARAYGPNGLRHESWAPSSDANDALVTVDSEDRLVLVRSLDSRWRWLKRERSPLLALAENTWAAAGRELSEAARRATGADFAVVSTFRAAPGAGAFSPGVTRVSDVTPYFAPLHVVRLTGRELAAVAAAFAQDAQTDDDYVASIGPAPSAEALEPERAYTLVATPDGVYDLAITARLTPRALERTDWTAADAIERQASAKP